jgi:hypothetical protein
MRKEEMAKEMDPEKLKVSEPLTQCHCLTGPGLLTKRGVWSHWHEPSLLPDHLPKALPLNAITLGVRTLAYGFRV